MAKLMGNNYRLFIESAVAGTFNQILGQQTLSQSQSSGLIDTSDKSNSPYGTSAPGLIDMTLNCDFVPDLPDANGFGRLEARYVGQNETNFQIRRAPYAVGDVVFAGACFITSLNKTYGQNDAIKASATLKPSSAPTTNLLS